MALDDKGDHFYLNLIENNDTYEKDCDEINPAPKLVVFTENIAKSLGHTEIRLNALEQLVSYYKELDYSPTGKTEKNNVYGLLVEMQKSLNS